MPPCFVGALLKGIFSQPSHREAQGRSAARREFAASLQAAGKRVEEDLKDHVSRHLKTLHDGVAAALEPLVQDTRTQASQIADAQAEQRQLRDRLAEIARDAAPGE